MDPFFEVVDRHYNARKEYEAMKTALESATTQYRTLQKRLLAKLKDTAAADAEDFGDVMESTYQEVRVRPTRLPCRCLAAALPLPCRPLAAQP